jgi:recombinational DNA repair ATPase RecF
MDETLQILQLKVDTANALIDKEAEKIQNLDHLKSSCIKRQNAIMQKRTEFLRQIETISNQQPITY